MLSKIRRQKLEKNIKMFYLYRVFCSLAFVSPIFILFLQDNGLSMIQIMILQSVYTAIIMVFIVPSGIIADYVGRKKVIVVNAFFYAAGWMIYALGNNFVGFLIAEIVMGLSTAMWLSSRTAFLYDTLRELGKEGSFKRLYGKVIGIEGISLGVAALAAGFIATYSLRLPFWFTFIPALFGLVITFNFTETKNYKHGDTKYLKHLKDAASFIAKHPKIRIFVIYSALFWSMNFMAYMFYQPYFTELKIPLVYFGVIYAAIFGATAIGAKFAHKIEERIGEKKILIFLALAMMLSFLGMGKVVIILGILFPLVIAFTAGVFDPVITDYVQKHVASHHRATVSSLGNLVTEGACATFAPFFGWIFDVYSLQAAFTVAGFILMLNIFILSLMYVVGWRRLRNGDKEIICK